MKIGSVIALLGTALVLPAAARASTLVAPMIFANNGTYVICQATNGGAQPAKVAITARDFGGSVVAPTDDTCAGGDVAPGATCFSFFDQNVQVTCTFQVKGKVRAAAALFDKSTNRPVEIVAATK